MTREQEALEELKDNGFTVVRKKELKDESKRDDWKVKWRVYVFDSKEPYKKGFKKSGINQVVS